MSDGPQNNPDPEGITASVKALIDSAGQSASIPHFYFNGLIMAQGTGDVTLILQLNNQYVAALNCSFTVAKTLAQTLTAGIQGLEKLSGREIMTVNDIARLAAKNAELK